MDLTCPHFLLYSHIDRAGGSGQWQFALRSKQGEEKFEAADVETGMPVERLDLLTVVRALESLDQPSRVTFVDCSDYIWKGVRYGLAEWRASDWRWEYYGQMVPVKNVDLWQRLDRALQFHDVECKRRRFDHPHGHTEGAAPAQSAVTTNRGLRQKLAGWLKYAAGVVPQGLRGRLQAAGSALRRGAGARSARGFGRDVESSASLVGNG